MEPNWITTIIVYFGLHCGAHLVGATVNNFQTFERDASWENLTVSSGLQFDTSSDSLLQCGVVCAGLTDCQSFFYLANLQQCKLVDSVLTSTSGAVPTPGAQYYHHPVVNTAHHDCNVNDDTEYTTVTLSDNSQFTYRIYRNAADQATSLSNCNSVGGGVRLVQVLTLAKFTFLRNIIKNCSDYSGSSFWIDGSNANATDQSDITQWTTATGQPLPSTTDFWVSGHPNSPTVDHCVPIWQSLDHFWTDRTCAEAHPYICEQV